MDTQESSAWSWLDAELQSLHKEIQTIRSTVHSKCPVCEGCGTVPNDFYRKTATKASSRIQCRSCSGRGVITSDLSQH